MLKACVLTLTHLIKYNNRYINKIHRMTDIHKTTNIKNDIHLTVLKLRRAQRLKTTKKHISLNNHNSKYKNHKYTYTQNQTQTMRPKTLNNKHIR